MAKKTDVSYKGQDDSSHTRIDKMPGVNVGHNPRTGAVESLKTSGREAREALIRELQAVDDD
jgi:hypothetical protein